MNKSKKTGRIGRGSATAGPNETMIVPHLPSRRGNFKSNHMPAVPAHCITDYQSQGQTIGEVIVDIGQPPICELIPSNAYVSLSRSRGRDNIRLLCGFDEKLFTAHPNEHL